MNRLPFETSGFAPRISRWSVRSTSGTGTPSIVPNISPADTCLGIWSTVEALKTLRVPSALSSARPYSGASRLWALGLPR